MSRAWDEAAAGLFDVIPAGTAILLLLFLGALAGALWYFWPRWLPRRLAWPDWLRRRPRNEKKPKPVPVADDEAPAPVITPAEPERVVADLTLADRLAAEGRYAEALRQRLRVTLSELVAARLVPSQPGWTAAELAAMAGGQRPSVAGPLGGATELFAEVWYGRRTAAQAHDQHMRALTEQIRAAI
ncbi:DUF4129 domain-containing protein [Actinoplanes sp. NPDC049265]|uniref:DUF4129 domain-containing protein n=1 Tax=Actinoplanes sp. NPDC049265 TaxID=3363902 RepID=UPI00371FB8D0